MKKISIISIISIIFVLLFNNQIIGIYFSHKLSNWVSREVSFDRFLIDYPKKIEIENIKIKNSDKEFENYIFVAEKIRIIFDISSLFSNLVFLESLEINSPEFFLSIKENNENQKGKDSRYLDNIGIVDKINKDLPDKVWPKKVRDINFLIETTKLINPQAQIQITSKNQKTKINLSNMSFNNIGNEKGYQHYKEILKFIFFDIINRVSDPELKNFLKNTYNFK